MYPCRSLWDHDRRNIYRRAAIAIATSGAATKPVAWAAIPGVSVADWVAEEEVLVSVAVSEALWLVFSALLEVGFWLVVDSDSSLADLVSLAEEKEEEEEEEPSLTLSQSFWAAGRTSSVANMC